MNKTEIKTKIKKMLNCIIMSTITLISFTIIIGCTQNLGVQEEIKSLQDKVEFLQIKVDSLEKKDEMLKEIDDLLAKVSDERGALFSLDEKGYDLAVTRSGTFYISLKKIEPYVNGFKVSIEIGNPRLIKYLGFDGDVYWSKSPLTPFLEDEDDSKKNHKTYSFTETLMPGSWTSVNFIIPKTDAEEINNLKIFIKPDRIALSGQ